MAHSSKASVQERISLVGKLLRYYKAIGMEEVYVTSSLKKTLTPAEVIPRFIDSAGSLNELHEVWGECTRCRLHKSRTHLVFGEGNSRARLVFVGEGPGSEEDRLGRPFVGKAGALLTDIIVKGMKLSRSSVYITNIVKCRPPGNREPEPDEIRTCAPLLWRQLEIIKPDIVCTLGKVAAHAVLDSHEPISVLRGSLHEVKGFWVMPTFHPAYLLRNVNKKRETWEDMKAIMKAFPKLQ
jgi:DNA polymerase